LIHLDLTNTGLSEKMIEEIGPALRRSKAMRSIHLSGNPGLDDPETAEPIIDKIVKRAHCIREDEYNVIEFKNMPSNKAVKD